MSGQRFEYKVLSKMTTLRLEHKLNQIAADGWRLVAAYPGSPAVKVPDVTYIFEREIPN